jgi:hypothetical protein
MKEQPKERVSVASVSLKSTDRNCDDQLTENGGENRPEEEADTRKE